jgi:hypothetical protein
MRRTALRVVCVLGLLLALVSVVGCDPDSHPAQYYGVPGATGEPHPEGPLQTASKSKLLAELTELQQLVETGQIQVKWKKEDLGWERDPSTLEEIARLESELLAPEMVGCFSERATREAQAETRAEIESWPEVERTEFYAPAEVPARYVVITPNSFSGYLLVWLKEPEEPERIYENQSLVLERMVALMERGGVQASSRGDMSGEVDAAAYLLNYMTSHAKASTPAARAWLKTAPFWQYIHQSA